MDQDEPDPDILALLRADRLLDAARLVSARGRPAQASVLFERGCDWVNAAEEALRAHDPRRAIDLAIVAGAPDLAERAVVQATPTPETAETIAHHLASHGHDRWAARLFEATGRTALAAQAWERAGEAVRASGLFESLGDVPHAVRVLEAALRREPLAWAVMFALGALLVRLARDQAAVRLLQRIPDSAIERRAALTHMVRALGRLGLTEASSEAARQLDALGGPSGAASTPVGSPDPATGTRLFGRYEVKAQIASSPIARVLDCVDSLRGERVALKLFAVSDRQGGARATIARFARELRVLHARPHPSIVSLRDLFEEAPATALAWMDGGTLDEMLAAGSIAPARAVEIADAVLGALAEAHRLGILHRNVKPANVLFDAGGAARVSDFGTALLSDVTTTVTVGPSGSMGYKSPEEREGRPPSARSDVFAAGILLHQMLTGQRPNPTDAARVQPSAVHGELDPRHDAVVARLIATRPEARPTDASEARDEILALAWPRNFGTRSGRATTEAPKTARPRGERLAIAAGGATVDTWTGRAITRLPLSDGRIARARAFALADHPALQPILRVDREGATIWLLALDGGPLQRPLSAEERASLHQALRALHAAGGVHGAVDAAHVTVDAALGLVLRFPQADRVEAIPERDHAGLESLAGFVL